MEGREVVVYLQAMTAFSQRTPCCGAAEMRNCSTWPEKGCGFHCSLTKERTW